MASDDYNECKPQGVSQSSIDEGTTLSNGAFSFTSNIPRRSLDGSSDQGQYVDMDLAIPIQLRTVRGIRLQKSLDSQEFEFNMSVHTPDFVEQVPVAPADELFYKGQLLPLQADPRLQLVQTLSSNQQGSEEPSQKLHPCSLGNDDVKFSSCRLDRLALDTGLLDSRCSSFRSQNSSLWESAGDKDTGDSGSSRDSNGSSQDSCYSGENGEKEMLHSHGGVARIQPGKSQTQHRRRSPHSWKSLFHGLKKASKIWVDDRADGPNSGSTFSGPSKHKPQGLSLRSRNAEQACGGAFAGQAPSVLKKESNSRSQRQMSCDFFSGELRTAVATSEEGFREKQSTLWDSTSSFSTVHKSSYPGEREKHRTAWHSKERWQRYVKKLKPLYVKISQRFEERGLFSQLRMDDCGRGASIESSNHSSSIKPPLERSLSRSSLHAYPDYTNSSRYLTVASCPASMLSSPNHSGVLAVINKSPNMSSMQELQSAIQGAIAHCKQSLQANE